MSVVIRLSKMGKRGESRYRVVVKEKRSRRDGKNIETLGWWEKRETGDSKVVDMKRVDYWLSQGAKPTPTIAKLLNL